MTKKEKLLKKLLKWFEENKKVYDQDNNFEDVYSDLKIKETPKMGYGIIYEGKGKKFVNDKNVVLKVPYEMFLSFENIVNRDFEKRDGFTFWLNYEGGKVNEIYSKVSKGMGNTKVIELKKHEIEEAFLTLFLALNKKRSFEHFWRPWTDYLVELKEQGKRDAYLLEFAQTIWPLIIGWYDEAEKGITDWLPKPELSDINHDNNQIYWWAYSIVKTRCSKPASDNPNTYFIPIIDFFNTNPDSDKKEELFRIIYHFNKRESKYDYVTISVEPGKSIEIKKGEQIFIDYGENLKYYGLESSSKKLEAQIEILSSDISNINIK